MPSTIRLHRVLKTTPDKVYRAFTDADAWCRFLPPHGFLGSIDKFEPKVGGRFHMSFRNFTTNEAHAFGGEFLELVPNRKLAYSDVFDDTDVIPESMCYLGWQVTLAQLRDLVEPDIRQ